MKFELSVFRFNAKTDYLPYYKKYSVVLDENLKLCDLLESIKNQDMFFNYPTCKNAAVVVNGYAVCTQIELKKIKDEFGAKLKIEPLNSKRSVHDLVINSDDFDKIFSDFDNAVGECEKDVYDKYIRYFYASHALKYNKNFQGTSLFLFAHYLILKYPQMQEDILKFISCKENGIWYHTSTKFKVFPCDASVDEKINGLKKEIYKNMPESKAAYKISEKFKNL